MFDDEFEIIEDDLLDETSTSPSKISNKNINNKNNIPIDKKKDSKQTSFANNSPSLNSKNNIDNGNQFKKAGNVDKLNGAISSNDPDVQKEALKTAGKDAIKPIVRQGVQAATGGLVGSDPVTSGLIDKAVDKVAEDPNVDKVIDDVANQINKKKKVAMLAIILSAISSFFLILVIIIAIMMPITLASDLVTSVGGFFESLGNWLIGNGWCAGAECQNLYETKYYEAMETFENKYNAICDIEWNYELISATIFYEQMMISDELEDDSEINEDGLVEGNNSLYSYKGADKKFNELVNVLYPNIDNENFSESRRCQAQYNSYSSYLTNTYIDNNFKKAGKPEYPEYPKDLVVEEIMAFGNEIIIENAYAGSYYCSGVTVLDQDGNVINTYDLEKYVAGVVEAESYASIAGMEALKAQAILARTFVLKTTNNCANPIESSQRQQVFKEPTPGGKAEQAAVETEGMILQYDGELVTAQYDSFCYEDSDCPDSVCNDTYCSVTYTKLPNNEKHTVTVPIKWKPYFVPGGGHARGLSQLASYDMAENGYGYDSILFNFYSPGVEIAKMTGLLQGAVYTSSSPPPLNAEVIQQRASNNQDMFYNRSMGLVSQCPWYAKSRAAEILYYSDMPEELKQAAIKSISNTGGNGGDVVANMDDTIFIKSYDYTQPHPGTVVSWSSKASDGPGCHNYGHVAIIEQVNEDGTVMISDGWNGGGPDGANIWQNIRYRLRSSVSLDYLSGYTNDGCTYTFAGYGYLLG